MTGRSVGEAFRERTGIGSTPTVYGSALVERFSEFGAAETSAEHHSYPGPVDLVLVRLVLVVLVLVRLVLVVLVLVRLVLVHLVLVHLANVDPCILKGERRSHQGPR